MWLQQSGVLYNTRYTTHTDYGYILRVHCVSLDPGQKRRRHELGLYSCSSSGEYVYLNPHQYARKAASKAKTPAARARALVKASSAARAFATAFIARAL